MEERSHPTTRYQPANVPDYSSITERRRLTGPVLRRFFKIMQKWKIDTKGARLLLGGITSQRFKQLSTHPEGRILNQDQLLRATNVIAIDQSLHKLLPQRQADKNGYKRPTGNSAGERPYTTWSGAERSPCGSGVNRWINRCLKAGQQRGKSKW